MSSREFSPTMEESKPELEEIQNVYPNSFSPTNQPKGEDIQEDEEYSNSAIVEAVNNGEEEEDNPNLNPNPNPNNQEDFECLDCHAKLECPNCHANHFNKNQDIPKVPGFRFNPLDYELIVYYLKKKVRNEPLPHNKIREVELYKSNPDHLTENYPGIGEKQWYFFTPRDRKYKNGTRPNRAAGSGYWKATGADKPVYYMGVPVGHRKALVFYHGKAPKGDKTNWIMHEYRVDEPPRSRTSDNDMRLDDWVLCRIYKKDDKIIKAPKHNDDPYGSSIPPLPLSDGSSPVTATETDLGENPNPNDYNCNGIVSNGLANSYVNCSQMPIQNGLGAITPPYDTFNNHLQPNFSFSVQPLTISHQVFPYQSVFPSKYEPEDWALLNLDSIDPALQFDMLSTNYIDPMLNFDNVLPNNGGQTTVNYPHQQMDS